MNPILFHLGPFPLYSFGFMVALGVLLSLWLMNRTAQRTGFPEGDGVFDMVFTVVVSGFLGARLYYVLQNAAWYFENPLHIFYLWEGGLVFYGGMMSGFLGLWVYFYFKKIPPAKGLDFILPFVALSHAFGRLGCFLNGCCYGKICELPWGVKFPQMLHAVHPAQLYEAFFDFLLFAFLFRRYEKKRFEGEIAALYFCLYACVRFFVEFFRDGNPFLGVLTVNQWASLALFLVSGFFYISKSKKAEL